MLVALTALCALIVCVAVVLPASAKNLAISLLTVALLSGASFKLLGAVFGVACASTVVFVASSGTHTSSLWMHVSWAVVCSHVGMIILAYLLVMGGTYRDKDRDRKRD